MDLKQRIIQRLIQNRSQKPQKTLTQLWLDLQELEILTTQASRANKLYCEELAMGTERIRQESEARSRQSATTSIQHQPEPQPLTNEHFLQAAKDPQKWSQLMETLSPQLRAMEAKYLGR